MRPEDRDPKLLWDMLNASRHVQAFIVGRTRAEYENDLLLKSAVERQVEIVGEAARGISEAFEAMHPEIVWQKIRSSRHILAHDYGRINDDVMWRIATIHLPELIRLLEPLIMLPPE